MEDLDHLRAQLDEDRLEFLRTDLKVSFTFAEMAETEYGMGELEAAGKSLAHGEDGYATLRRFLTDPRHTTHLTGDQLQELNTGVGKLRHKLDDLHRLHTPR